MGTSARRGGSSGRTISWRRLLLALGVWLAALTFAVPILAAGEGSGELFGGLPLELAIKEVRGSGALMVAIFEDPTCTHCKALEREVASMNDVVIYRFLYPILSDEAVAPSRRIWCARDRVKAWKAWVASGRLGAGPLCDSSAIDRVVEFGKVRKIRAVPAIFIATGERLPAATSRMELEMAIGAPKVIAFQQSLLDRRK